MEGLYALLRKIIRNQKKIIQEQKKQTELLTELVQEKPKLARVVIDEEKKGNILLCSTEGIFINGEQVASTKAGFKLTEEKLSEIGKGIVKEV